jgi:hypothetical protein
MDLSQQNLFLLGRGPYHLLVREFRVYPQLPLSAEVNRKQPGPATQPTPAKLSFWKNVSFH